MVDGVNKEKEKEEETVIAIHEPAAIGGDVGLGDDEVEIGEKLHHLQ